MSKFVHIPPNRTEFGVCPICGHKDYCSMDLTPDGQRFFFCRRGEQIPYALSEKGQVIGTPFGNFVFKGVNAAGALRFEEETQLKKRREDWKASQDFQSNLSKYDNSNNNYIKTYTEEELRERDQFYRAFLNCLYLESYHYSKLSEEWGNNTNKWANAYLIKSMPPVDSVRFNNKRYKSLKNPTRKKLSEKLKSIYPEKGVAGFWLDEKYGVQFYAEPGIIYPIFNSKGQITCLRIGVDNPTISSTLGDIRWSSFSGDWQLKIDERWESIYSEKNGIAKVALDSKGLPVVENRKIANKYKYVYSGNKEGGSSYGSQVGMYLPIKEDGADYDYSVCFGTEGEKKCIVGSNHLKAPFVDITGVSNYKRMFKPEDGSEHSILEVLKERGCKYFVVAYDADKNANLNVLQAERGFLVELIDKGITPAVAEWSDHWGKGLDDAILKGGVTPMYYVIKV